jgi:3-hydroxyacyl-CoA dehydrogenase/enoyl-CoA hydratase/3-hydroxybutyryl-CoA epimerase
MSEVIQPINGLKHWRYFIDADNVFHLEFNKHETNVNTMDQDVIAELAVVIQTAKDAKPKALILTSAKKSGFIAGADIKQFAHLKTVAAAVSLMHQGQDLFTEIENLPFTTVVVIDGFCMGGGCELALAFDYRIAVDQPKTSIGLPEVKLGIHPGWGGTVRLPKLIGIIKAMPLILTGNALRAVQAKKLGIVSAAVPPRNLRRAINFYINQGKNTKFAGKSFFMNLALVRKFIGGRIRKQLAAKACPEHYPAPFAVVDNWVRFGIRDENKAYKVEAESIAKCMVDPTARNLVDVFFMMEELKSHGKSAQFKAQNVHVIGAGTMGGDIAAWCALRGMTVTLQDREAKYLVPAMTRAKKLYEKKLKLPNLVQQSLDRLIPDVAGYGVAKADIIIEAIFENLQAKQELFRHLERHAPAHAVLATNTSSIPLQEISAVMQNPERLVGIHFFNPVAQMPLVEVVHSASTSPTVVAAAQAFVVQIGKWPLAVDSQPGFFVNRVLMPYLMEAVLLYEEGVEAKTIDRAAVAFGMPMGPVRLADQVGLDICLSVANNLAAACGMQVPEKLKELVANGHLGCKTGKGFYTYSSKDKADKPTADTTGIPADVSDRLILAMVNEAMACLRRGVVASEQECDAGMIFGTGFAPFRAGPMHYARARGIDNIIAALERLSAKYGARFTPDVGWHSI